MQELHENRLKNMADIVPGTHHPGSKQQFEEVKTAVLLLLMHNFLLSPFFLGGLFVDFKNGRLLLLIDTVLLI